MLHHFLILMERVNNKMLKFGIFQLTHPETLSEVELQEILEDSCIDSSTYKNLSRPKLIDLYKRVAMPLPQRQCQSEQNSGTKGCNEGQNSDKELHKNFISLNGIHDVNKDKGETEICQSSCASRKSPLNELKDTSKKIRLYNSNNVGQSNGADKRVNDGKHNDSPSKKRQKITWP